MKHFINLKDIPHKDLRKIIVDAKKRKKQRKKLNTLEPDKGSPLKGKMLVQMFEKASSRTRISFYLAIKQLGGGTLTLRSNELHLGQGGESIADTAKILSTYGDGFMLRTDSDKKIEDFKPVNAGQVGLYVCGMTVYDHAHVGHARAMVVFDAFVRYLRPRRRLEQAGNRLHEAEASPMHVLWQAWRQPKEAPRFYLVSPTHPFGG